MNEINQKIAELKSLLNKEYLENLSREGQEKLYSSLIDLCLTLFEGKKNHLREREMRKAFFTRKIWSVWKNKQNEGNSTN